MRQLAATTAFLLASWASANPVAGLQKRAALDDCLKSAAVPTDAKGSNDWNADVAPFNQRLPYTPAAIAVPTSVAHVQAAVSCAVKSGIKVSAKGGGHSYASFGLGGEDGHLVLEMDRMYQVTLDTATNVATVQSGARLGHALTGLWTQGKRAFSHGTCAGVGVAGHSLHGGFGFSSHKYGLALDWMVGATVVLANSTVVDCSATQNSDLFWALRGAGSSFGAVTSFKFNTFAPPPSVTVFSINLPWNNVAGTVSGWTALQKYVQDTMPFDMNMRIMINSFTAQIQGLWYGDSSSLQTAAAPLLSTIGNGASLSGVQTTDWMGGFNAYANGETIDVSVPYNKQENFFSKSLATTALPAAAMTGFANYWFNTAKSNSRSWYVIIDMHGGNHSYIANQSHDSTAYAHRDKLFLYEFYDRSYFGGYPANGLSFLNGWVDATTSPLTSSQWGMYINYADPTMNRTYAQDVYWRQNVPRLQSIKAAVDPNEVFYFPQGIQPKK